MQEYEKLGAFYLGKEFDQSAGKLKDDVVLYDSKDLNTHAVIIGMTGSGKTGLGIGLLEEALIDNIPIIAIDPKGDLPNLLLSFPELQTDDFLPWINEQDALNKGYTNRQYAKKQADLWRKGLGSWGQEPERIARFKESADFTVYTPGSVAGTPVNVLRSFSPPPSAIVEDTDLLRERIQTTVTGLLSLLGVEADPLTSREHILVSNIFENYWTNGKGLDLGGLIRAIQTPPFERIGVMELDFFYPAKDRATLAMRLNNLLAAPGFETWMQGDPLDIGKMLYTDTGKPRASIFTISHLSDAERMFFVSTLLNEILGWVRTQSGTTSLRAILYMDEIFGYFPPVSNPPSKGPLLTLLKQARAYGLGVVLSTQNPVDLDYKGLANTGTWFIGRLQTERDKSRVMEGLQGASSGLEFNRKKLEEILSGLGKRVFLLHNVHESEPVIFQTRWVLSYLRGPMTRDQIKILVADQKKTVEQISTASEQTRVSAPLEKTEQGETVPPLTPAGVQVFYMEASGAGQGLVYYPAIVGRLDVHYSSKKHKVISDETVSLAAELEDGPMTVDWDNAIELDFSTGNIEEKPLPGSEFAELPADAKKTKSYDKWSKNLMRWVRQNRSLKLFMAKDFKMASLPGETESDFRARLSVQAREKRDLAVEKLRRKYSSKFTTLKDRLARAEHAISREQEQAKSKKMDTVISFGTALLGAFMGRKAVSSTSASRMGTAMKSAGRMRKEKMDVERAKERAESVQIQMQELEEKLQDDIDKIEITMDPSSITLEEMDIYPKSTNLALEVFGLVWLPYRRDAKGRITPDWS